MRSSLEYLMHTHAFLFFLSALHAAPPAADCGLDARPPPVDTTQQMEKTAAELSAVMVTMVINGLDCEKDSQQVTDALMAVDGVVAVMPDPWHQRVEVIYYPAKVSVHQLGQRISPLKDLKLRFVAESIQPG